MKKINSILVASIVFGAIMSGCANSGPSNPAFVIKNDSNSSFVTIDYLPAGGKVSKYENLKNSADPQRYTNATCTRNAFLYLAARESLKRGYPYFAIADGPGKAKTFDNNMLGLPTTSNEAYNNYCNPQYNFKKSGLEHDKCEWRKTEFPLKMATHTNTRVQMFKEKSYLFPTWDAKKTMEEARPKANACVNWEGYNNPSLVHDIDVSETIVAKAD